MPVTTVSAVSGVKDSRILGFSGTVSASAVTNQYSLVAQYYISKIYVYKNPKLFLRNNLSVVNCVVLIREVW